MDNKVENEEKKANKATRLLPLIGCAGTENLGLASRKVPLSLKKSDSPVLVVLILKSLSLPEQIFPSSCLVGIYPQYCLNYCQNFAGFFAVTFVHFNGEMSDSVKVVTLRLMNNMRFYISRYSARLGSKFDIERLHDLAFYGSWRYEHGMFFNTTESVEVRIYDQVLELICHETCERNAKRRVILVFKIVLNILRRKSAITMSKLITFRPDCYYGSTDIDHKLNPEKLCANNSTLQLRVEAWQKVAFLDVPSTSHEANFTLSADDEINFYSTDLQFLKHGLKHLSKLEGIRSH